jgi:predicted glycosyltransferase
VTGTRIVIDTSAPFETLGDNAGHGGTPIDLAARGSGAQVWIDIDNPPQVQYLVPFVEAFGRRGASVVLTARDYGNALELLRLRRVPFVVVGKEFGRSKIAKVVGVLDRARRLTSLLQGDQKPDVLLSTSRSSALAARWMRIPSFVIDDYEYANSSFYRLTRSIILYPDVVDPAPFLDSGLRSERLRSFHGIKEDISLADVEWQSVTPHRFAEIRDDRLIRVLFRPPAEHSHYFDPKSLELSLQALAHLAQQKEAVVIFAPRHDWQRDHLKRFRWTNDPVVLETAIPFVSLLKSVDLVICSGGTMLREAAYLGVPAYSILKSRIGGVDRYLASLGRVELIGSPDELSKIELKRAPTLSPLNRNPDLLEELAGLVLESAAAGVL